MLFVATVYGIAVVGVYMAFYSYLNELLLASCYATNNIACIDIIYYAEEGMLVIISAMLQLS